jgi:hypothetical protein
MAKRAKLLEQLYVAEQRVADGYRQIARQYELIERLDRSGWSARGARFLLQGLEESQAAYVAARDQLRKDVAPKPRRARVARKLAASPSNARKRQKPREIG